MSMARLHIAFLAAPLLAGCLFSPDLNPDETDGSTDSPGTTTGGAVTGPGPADSTAAITTDEPPPATSADTEEPTTGTPPATETGDETTTGEPITCESSPYTGMGDCDPYAQDCPDGFKCTPYAQSGSAWNSTRCAALDPNPVGVGDPCLSVGGGATGDDNCERGAMCFDVDATTLVGTCIALCACGEVAGETSCPADSNCTVANNGELPLCSPSCDPLLIDCAPGNVCIPDPMTSEFFYCVPDASGAGGGFGLPCE
ncbi:MAG: hypothetical protein K0V04_30415, partial [Deltaproteobacteria bacterium]|nr:hypothetical protein [Deltaproteobacteria bacterium]